MNDNSSQGSNLANLPQQQNELFLVIGYMSGHLDIGVESKWHSKTGPFGHWTILVHLNTRLVRYSDPHLMNYNISDADGENAKWSKPKKVSDGNPSRHVVKTPNKISTKRRKIFLKRRQSFLKDRKNYNKNRNISLKHRKNCCKLSKIVDQQNI